jgi:hypothetical protein
VLDTDGRKTKFTDNLPGKAWYKAFTTRNPEISTRKPATLGHQRASISYEMVDGKCLKFIIISYSELQR